jgi:Nif-specific regulatory protein
VISGPLEGQVFGFEGEQITIGREPANNISIPDSSLSRNHCRIERRGLEFRLTDLGSRNGTLVNGSAVAEHSLRHGDQIRIGNCVILFRRGNTSVPAGPPKSGQPSELTLVLRREDTVYLRPSEAVPPLPANERTVRDLDILLRFSKQVSSLRGVDELRQTIIESLEQIAPADLIAVLLRDEGTGDLSTLTAWDRREQRNTEAAVSSTIVSRVLDEGVAILSNDVAGDEGLQDAASLLLRRVHSVAAVPLTVLDKVIGLLYLDGTDPQAGFDRGTMQLLAALGNIAALAIENARHFEWLEGENRRLQEELRIQHDMIGESPAIKEVFQFISRVAARDATVLIFGESGTGKELVARAVHRNSLRSSKPFVAINCAAITETLLESELFGHEKGAFTGAVAQKKGKLEVAEGGTVFLDEIGELAPQLQAKLLRVLQEREFERVGGTRPIKLDIRLIAATNRDLRAEVRQGRFREDLYYRLNVVSVKMPALRERREDIPLLAMFFAAKACESVKRPVVGISPKARACLMRYEWPGNVRELENAIERAVVLGSSEVILPEDLPDAIIEEAAGEEEAVTPLHDALLAAKRRIIENAIEQAGGNYTDAAKALGVHPNHFFRLIRTLNLKPKRQR